MQWKTINKKDIDLVNELVPYLNNEGILIHIGTDAQANGANKADFVTVVAVHTIGKGARVFYKKECKVVYFSLWEKLFLETNKSLEVAVELSEYFPSTLSNRILVHVDANPDVRYASSKHVKALAGMVMGYGFKHVLKPNAFVASHCADHIVKNKN